MVKLQYLLGWHNHEGGVHRALDIRAVVSRESRWGLCWVKPGLEWGHGETIGDLRMATLRNGRRVDLLLHQSLRCERVTG